VDLTKRQTVDTPKTTRGRRLVTLDPDALETLKRHRTRQNVERLKLGPDYDDRNLVFATSLGTPLSQRNVIRSFKAALRRAGFDEADHRRIRLYDLRHFHVTEAADAGVSVKALSARVGHASVAFTLDRYAHALEAGDREVAEAVARRLKRAAREADNQERTGTDPN
jgi:integrase